MTARADAAVKAADDEVTVDAVAAADVALGKAGAVPAKADAARARVDAARVKAARVVADHRPARRP